jgi:hypothetical protein
MKDENLRFDFESRWAEDAYNKRARIIRKKSDLTTEIVTVDSIEQALSGNLESDIALYKEDVVTVFYFRFCRRI